MEGVSIIIPVYNGGYKLLACLDSLVKLNYKEKEIIIVDNNSSDNIPWFAKQFKDFKVIKNKENLGVAKATNIGIKNAKYDLILTLDQDVLLEKNCLKELVKIISKNKSIGIVSPKIFNKTSNNFQGAGFKMSPIIMKTSIIYNVKDILQEIDYVPGAVVLSRKGIAMMDEDYFLYYSDAQYSLDIRKKGYKIVYVPKAKAWHDCNTAEGFTPVRIKHYIKSKLLFAMKNNKHFFLFMLYFYFIYTPVKLFSFLIRRQFSLSKAYMESI